MTKRPPREFIRRDKLDFSRWTWVHEKTKEILDQIADEVAEIFAEDMSECLYATLRYNKEKEAMVVCAELQADDLYEDYVEVQSTLPELVEFLLDNICHWTGFSVVRHYVGPEDDGTVRRQLDSMSKTFLDLHKQLEAVLSEPEPEHNRKYREKKAKEAEEDKSAPGPGL